MEQTPERRRDAVIALTEQQIADAKNNDLTAVTAVVEATEERVQQLARRYATGSGRTDLDLQEDLAQNGRVAVWEALGRFNGQTVAEFFVFIDRTVQGVMSDARKVETRPGVTRSIASEFERALSIAGGDPFEAEKVAQSDVMGKKKLSPEMAYAARLSWQGVEYLDAPASSGDGEAYASLLDKVADRVGVSSDLVEPSDYAKVRRDETRDNVHTILDRMGRQQNDVLKATFGIDPVGLYGTENDDEIAADFGIERHRVRVIRSLGKTRFAKLWTEAGF
jgi:RNA polymerase sigma factor (sigma-70 family)